MFQRFFHNVRLKALSLIIETFNGPWGLWDPLIEYLQDVELLIQLGVTKWATVTLCRIWPTTVSLLLKSEPTEINQKFNQFWWKFLKMSRDSKSTLFRNCIKIKFLRLISPFKGDKNGKSWFKRKLVIGYGLRRAKLYWIYNLAEIWRFFLTGKTRCNINTDFSPKWVRGTEMKLLLSNNAVGQQGCSYWILQEQQ